MICGLIAKMLQHCAAALIVISETTLTARAEGQRDEGRSREFAKAVRAGDATFALDLPRAVDQWLGAA